MCMRKVQVEMWKYDSDYWEVVDVGTPGRSDDRDLDRFGSEIGGYSH